MNPSLAAVRDEAYTARAVGICILPPAEDGTKRPDPGGAWNPYKTTQPTDDEMARWYPGRSGLGVVVGVGNVECWDFDDRQTYEAVLEAAEACGLFSLIERLEDGYCDDTPGGGVRWLVRYTPDIDRDRDGKGKLARRPKRLDEQRDPHDKVKTLIELPDYAIVAPSNGRVHPSGKGYQRRSGDFSTIVTYTAEERSALIDLCRSFDQMPKASADDRPREQQAPGDRPGDDFIRRATWTEVLEPHGWRRAFQRGDVTHWRRPGKQFGGSATTNFANSDLLYVYSSSTGFEAERGYSKFSAYAILNHGGDFKAAARALRAAGYGTAREQPAAADESDTTCDTAPHVFNQSDSGNAEYFAQRHGSDVRFDFRRERWLLWRRQRWQPDADAEIRRLAKSAMRQRFQDAATLADSDARQRAAKWAIGSESRSRLDALLYLAQAEPPIADTGDGWDADSCLLGVPNGVVDLRSGALRPARREDRMTLAAGVEYDADARSDLWDATLQAILPDAGVLDFFHVAIGYSATGDTRCDCWFLGCGSGRNGKGTLLQAIRRALGDYALELPGSIFDLRAERSPYELAYLPGRRFVTSSESGDTLRLHHDRIKQLTGGDSISAANKYEKAFEFEPTSKLWLACNKRPRTTDDTAAFWARVFLIPFTVSFVGKEDRSLRPILVQEPAHQAAVLAWIVRGAVRYHAQGLTEPPAAVRAATAAYREDSDPLGGFLSEACDLEPGAQVSAKELYEHYTHWANAQHFSEKERLSATMFGRHLAARFEHEHTRVGRVYRGLARRPL